MQTSDILNRMTPIFRDIFDDDNLELTREMTAADIEDWDSLSHIRLIVAIEKAFAIRFTVPEIESLSNVGQFAELIAQKVQ